MTQKPAIIERTLESTLRGRARPTHQVTGDEAETILRRLAELPVSPTLAAALAVVASDSRQAPGPDVCTAVVGVISGLMPFASAISWPTLSLPSLRRIATHTLTIAPIVPPRMMHMHHFVQNLVRFVLRSLRLER